MPSVATSPLRPAKGEKYPIQLLDLDAITVDHAIQSRVSTSIEYQRRFTEAMLRGDPFPPITVFFDGITCWLADGFHRYGGAKQAGAVDRNFLSIRAEVRSGTREDAILFSVGANREFCIERTNKDKIKAILMLLSLPHRSFTPVKEIQRIVGLENKTNRIVITQRAKHLATKYRSQKMFASLSQEKQIEVSSARDYLARKQEERNKKRPKPKRCREITEQMMGDGSPRKGDCFQELTGLMDGLFLFIKSLYGPEILENHIENSRHAAETGCFLGGRTELVRMNILLRSLADRNNYDIDLETNLAIRSKN